MLNDLLKTIQKLEAFDFAAAQRKAISDNTEVLADLQTQQWAETSTDNKGRPIRLLDNVGGEYRPFTVERKIKEGYGLGKITNRITLFQTGELYRQLFAQIKGEKVFFKSTVPYFSRLMKRTGDVTGLDRDHAREFANGYVLPFVNKDLKNKTGLSITSKTGVQL